MSFGLALRRELAVLVFGCGLCLPVISVIATGRGFFALRERWAAGWDEARELIAMQTQWRPTGFAGLARLHDHSEHDLRMLVFAALVKIANGAATG